MKKGVLFYTLLALSGSGHAVEKAYTGPDCSKDTDRRIFAGITDSLQLDKPVNKKHQKYFDQLIARGASIKITRLSSELISKKEALRLMLRRAKMDGVTDSQIKETALENQYLNMDLYRQYYLIESSKGFRAISEYYSSYLHGKWHEGSKEGESCGNDLENIYIISDQIYGHTVDFATR